MAGSATNPETMGDSASEDVKKAAKRSAVDRKREMYCTDNTKPWTDRYRQAVHSWR